MLSTMQSVIPARARGGAKIAARAIQARDCRANEEMPRGGSNSKDFRQFADPSFKQIVDCPADATSMR